MPENLINNTVNDVDLAVALMERVRLLGDVVKNQERRIIHLETNVMELQRLLDSLTDQ